ncbi:hypothetical protein FOA52_009634 [Chlamydomonas sp. UWO 241]|nr:hypothetical protein FOA52_009634 [Chlamydomonas sp. UWO 241]
MHSAPCLTSWNLIVAHLLPECTLAPDTREFQNVLYDSNPCLEVRYPGLLFITRREAEQLRRVLCSIVLGSIIGYERRSPDRPAGIRTMSVTALGACTFTLASMFAFVSGPMAWDASRISASIPSGVGFLGAGVVWKGFVKSATGDEDTHQVHGLTTAASIWLSAAVGVAAGGGMYFVATFSTLTIVLMLRFGPRNSDRPHDEHGNAPDRDNTDNTGAEANGRARDGDGAHDGDGGDTGEVGLGEIGLAPLVRRGSSGGADDSAEREALLPHGRMLSSSEQLATGTSLTFGSASWAPVGGLAPRQGGGGGAGGGGGGGVRDGGESEAEPGTPSLRGLRGGAPAAVGPEHQRMTRALLEAHAAAGADTGAGVGSPFSGLTQQHGGGGGGGGGGGDTDIEAGGAPPREWRRDDAAGERTPAPRSSTDRAPPPLPPRSPGASTDMSGGARRRPAAVAHARQASTSSTNRKLPRKPSASLMSST